MAKTHRQPTRMRNPNQRELSARVVRRETIGFDELTRAFLGIATARAEAAAGAHDGGRSVGQVDEEDTNEASA